MKPFRIAFVVTAILFAARCSTAQPALPLVFDKEQSAWFGAYNIAFVQKAVYSLQDKYIPDTFKAENSFFRKAAGVGYRLSKLALLDFQEDYLLFLTQHEAFGHTARFREFGSRQNSVRVNLFFPFGDGSGSSQSGAVIGNYTPHKNLAVSLSGVEANKVLANTLVYNFLQSDSIHYRQALLYLLAQNDQLLYAWTDRLREAGSSGGRDMLGYVSKLNNLYNPTQNPYSIEKLSLQSLSGLANPLQVYAAFTVLYSYGLKGRKHLTGIPMIKLGKVRYLPYLNYQLTPFGSEYLLCNIAKHKGRLFAADFGIGEGTFNRFYSAQLKVFNLVRERRLALNAYSDIWLQPELQLDYGSVTSAGNQTGGLFKLDCMIRPFPQSSFSLFAQVGYKTKGYVLGEALSEGAIFRFGISL